MGLYSKSTARIVEDLRVKDDPQSSILYTVDIGILCGLFPVLVAQEGAGF